MNSLSNEIYYEGPTVFTSGRLAKETDLLCYREALYFTPTANLPQDMVGKGKLEVNLPIPFPTLFEWESNLACRVPRLWVDLIQRATGKLRWTPMVPAKVTLIRFDSCVLSTLNVNGAKALIDALKLQTTGRRDRRMLYYFGAIRDDNPDDLKTLKIEQRLISEPSKAYTQIVVELASKYDRPGMTISLP